MLHHDTRFTLALRRTGPWQGDGGGGSDATGGDKRSVLALLGDALLGEWWWCCAVHPRCILAVHGGDGNHRTETGGREVILECVLLVLRIGGRGGCSSVLDLADEGRMIS